LLFVLSAARGKLSRPPQGQVRPRANRQSRILRSVARSPAESRPPRESRLASMQQAKVESYTIEPNVATKPEQKQVIATVNGVSILKSDYEARVEQQISPVQRQMPANFFEQYKKELSKKVLDEMVVDILIGQKAKQKGLTVTDQEIDSRIYVIAQRQKMSLHDYRDMLKAKGEDFGQFRDKVRQNQLRKYNS